MTGATAFNPDDLELLLARYTEPHTQSRPRRPPWTWAALNRDERAALARMIDVFVATYNHVYATKDTELIPPCWPRHPALAADVAVQVWLWYFVHMDPTSTPQAADEYRLRRLPGFHARLDHHLGASPGECRRGEHPDSWRQDADAQIAKYLDVPTDPERDRRYVDLFGELHFGFPHLNDAGQS
jgi:hypothetical protein